MTRKATYSLLPTEQHHPDSERLARQSLDESYDLMQEEDEHAVAALAGLRSLVVRAAGMVAEALDHGGRLVYVGAGTSGRLGLLDAAECGPTFGSPHGELTAILAGGAGAVWRSRENAEDDRGAGARAVRNRRISSKDVVLGISASGVTPFVLGGLAEARRRSARTLLLTMNPPAVAPAAVDLRVQPSIGPEVLAGSSRMKAGTVTKILLQRISTLAMVRLGRVHMGWMIDVQPTSRKLRSRARRTLQALLGLEGEAASKLYRRAHAQVKIALVMHRQGLSYARAKRVLESTRGRLPLGLL